MVNVLASWTQSGKLCSQKLLRMSVGSKNVVCGFCKLLLGQPEFLIGKSGAELDPNWELHFVTFVEVHFVTSTMLCMTLTLDHLRHIFDSP